MLHTCFCAYECLCHTPHAPRPAQIATAATDIHHAYGGPLDIALGTVFLSRLLGWSAFAGYAAILALLPVNSRITKSAVRIQKCASVARDRRMQVVHELISAVRASIIIFLAPTQC